jgi:WD40 repeat protein
MIFVMREEYMAGVTEFEKFIPTFFSNRVRIEKMSHRNALEAIKGPCKAFNISLEEGFAETLLEKLSPGSEDVELTYLQVFLDKIFRLASGFIPTFQEGKEGGFSLFPEAKGSLSFTISLLNKAGNVSDLLGSFLDDQISLMDDPDSALTMLKAFVSARGTKLQANEEETVVNARSLGREISLESVSALIRKFVNLRVLRDKDDNGKYELRHDSLAEKIFEKFSLAEKELLEIRQMIETAYQYYLKRKILLNNEDLKYISNKDSALNLSPEIIGFLEESRKYQKAKVRTVRRLTFASAIVFLIMIFVLGYFAYIRLKEIRADYMAVKSINQVPDPLEAFQLAGAANKLSQGVLQKEALMKSFNLMLHFPSKDSVMLLLTKQASLHFESVPVKLQYAACSNDNKNIFGYGDSLLCIWNIDGRIEKEIITDHTPVIDMKLSNDSWYIGAVGSDSILTVWNIAGEKIFSTKTPYNSLNTKHLFEFTNKNYILSVSERNNAELFDNKGGILQEFDRHIGRVNAIDISSDDNFIATASSDKSVNIWYYNTLKNRYDFYNKLDWHKDTVWSVAFSNNRFTVISTSADSMLYIGNVNNESYFSLHGNTGFTNGEFCPSDRGFSFATYEVSENIISTKSYAFSYVNPRIELSNKYDVSRKIAGGDLKESGFGFSYLSLSKDDEFYLCGESETFKLIDNKMALRFDYSLNNTLLNIEGSKPFFTHDGKYVLAIAGNTFRYYFIDYVAINEIYSGIYEK